MEKNKEDDAEPMVTEDTPTAVEEAKRKLEKSWKSKEYFVTMEKKSNGKVKMTTWAVCRVYRTKYNQRQARIKAIWLRGRKKGEKRTASSLVKEHVKGLEGRGVSSLQI